MSERADFESRLESRLRSRASHATPPFDAAAIARRAVAPGNRPTGIALRWASLPGGLRWSLVALALAGSVIGTLAIGGPLLEQSRRPAAVTNGWIAFTVETIDRNGYSNIYIVRPGELERRIISPDRYGIREICPQFSPDGTRIAYLSNQSDPPAIGEDRSRFGIRIVAVGADGVAAGAPQVLVNGVDGSACPEWAADGLSVVYMQHRTLHVHRLDGGSTTIDAGPSTGEPGAFAVSPTGAEIAYVGPSSVWIVSFDGEARRRVYEAPGDIQLDAPQWSPDGERIVVEATRVVQVTDGATIEDLPARIIQIDGTSEPIELAGVESIAWSPDGQRLAAFRSTTVNGLDWGELVTMTRHGTDVRVLADAYCCFRGLTWSPDGMQVAYVDDDYGATPGLLAVAASGDADPVVLLSKPYWLEYTNSEDLSWQAVFPR